MLIKSFKAERLEVFAYETRNEMGKAAAERAAAAISKVISEKRSANVIFAAAPSQNEMLAALISEKVDFSKINAFHMDEYEGLSPDSPQSFASYLTDHIFGKVKFASVNLIPAHLGADEACREYSELLEKFPPDVVCLGIGENGHIAFNDPPVADFNDPFAVKKVALDRVCRMQQVHDGCFPNIDAVPTHAITLTVPALTAAKHMICTVPAPTKAAAVKAMIEGEYGEICPATSLRKHPSAALFLDADSAKEVL